MAREYFRALSEADQQQYADASRTGAQIPKGDPPPRASPPTPPHVIGEDGEEDEASNLWRESFLQRTRTHEMLEGDWIGYKALGEGGFGRVGLWLRLDVHGNIADVSCSQIILPTTPTDLMSRTSRELQSRT